MARSLEPRVGQSVTTDGGGVATPESPSSASDITVGTLDDSLLSANVAMRNEANEFTETVTLSGDGTAFEDLRVSPSSGTKPASNPPVLKAFGPSGNLFAWSFDKTTNQQIFFEIQMPHSWLLESTIFPHVHWAPSDTNTGSCIWKLEYAWSNIDGTFGAPTTITASDVGDGTAWKHQIIAFESGAGIAGTGKTLSSILMCRLYRDAATDAYDNDAFLLAFDVHYEVDSFGSNEELSK